MYIDKAMYTFPTCINHRSKQKKTKVQSLLGGFGCWGFEVGERIKNNSYKIIS